jgi:hypothetical protein
MFSRREGRNFLQHHFNAKKNGSPNKEKII